MQRSPNDSLSKNQCRFCNTTFDSKERTPRILKDCGHTFCEKCIKEKLDQGFSVFCPIDYTIGPRNLKSYPKNMNLFDCILKSEQETPDQPPNQTNSQEQNPQKESLTKQSITSHSSQNSLQNNNINYNNTNNTNNNKNSFTNSIPSPSTNQTVKYPPTKIDQEFHLKTHNSQIQITTVKKDENQEQEEDQEIPIELSNNKPENSKNRNFDQIQNNYSTKEYESCIMTINKNLNTEFSQPSTTNHQIQQPKYYTPDPTITHQFSSKNASKINNFHLKKLQNACKTHPENQNEYLCIDCQQEICSDCKIFGPHVDHSVSKITEIQAHIEEKQKKLTDLQSQIKEKQQNFQQNIDTLYDQTIRPRVHQQREHLFSCSRKFFEDCNKALEDKRSQINKEITETFSHIQEKFANFRHTPEKQLFQRITNFNINLQNTLKNPLPDQITSQEKLEQEAQQILIEYEGFLEWPKQLIDDYLNKIDMKINQKFLRQIKDSIILFREYQRQESTLIQRSLNALSMSVQRKIQDDEKKLQNFLGLAFTPQKSPQNSAQKPAVINTITKNLSSNTKTLYQKSPDIQPKTNNNRKEQDKFRTSNIQFTLDNADEIVGAIQQMAQGVRTSLRFPGQHTPEKGKPQEAVERARKKSPTPTKLSKFSMQKTQNTSQNNGGNVHRIKKNKQKQMIFVNNSQKSLQNPQNSQKITSNSLIKTQKQSIQQIKNPAQQKIRSMSQQNKTVGQISVIQPKLQLKDDSQLSQLTQIQQLNQQQHYVHQQNNDRISFGQELNDVPLSYKAVRQSQKKLKTEQSPKSPSFNSFQFNNQQTQNYVNTEGDMDSYLQQQQQQSLQQQQLLQQQQEEEQQQQQQQFFKPSIKSIKGMKPNKRYSTVTEIIQSNKALEQIIKKIENRDQTLTTIDLIGEKLTNDQVKILSDYIRDYEPQVTQIKLVKNDIDDQGLLSLLKVLKNNDSVHTVNLTNNYCSNDTLKNVYQQFSGPKNSALSKILLVNNRISQQNTLPLIQQIRQNTGITIQL